MFFKKFFFKFKFLEPVHFNMIPYAIPIYMYEYTNRLIKKRTFERYPFNKTHKSM